MSAITKTWPECEAIIRAKQGDPAPGDLEGCPMGQGGTFIYGGEGDDQALIVGTHEGHQIVVDGGPGNDKVIRSETASGGFVAAIATETGPGVVAFVLLFALAAALVAAAIWGFSPNRHES